MINLRRSTREDAETVYRWRNDPEVRAVSRQQGEIDFATHASWFAERLPLTHPETIYILERKGKDIGSGRIDCYESDDRAEISIVLAPEYRRRGLGREAVQSLATKVMMMGRVPTAFVRLDNRLSLNTFLKAGFSSVGESLVGVVELQMDASKVRFFMGPDEGQ